MMKLMCIFGIVLALLIQASLQYPSFHSKKHNSKLLRFPETFKDAAFPDSNDNNEETNEPPRINDVNIVLLDSEDFMNLIAPKASDDSVLRNRDYPQKRFRRRVYDYDIASLPKPDPILPKPFDFPKPLDFPKPFDFPKPDPIFPQPIIAF